MILVSEFNDDFNKFNDSFSDSLDLTFSSKYYKETKTDKIQIQSF